MSVLIKNMDMPESCDKCALCVNGFTDDAPMYECTASGNDMTSVLVDDHGKPFDFRPDWCPLVEIKTLNGDLIGRDKLIQDFIDSDLDHLPRDDWKEILGIIKEADTVISVERRIENEH